MDTFLQRKKSKVLQQTPVKGRDCGECTACCVLPRIADRPELGMTSLPLLPDGKMGYTPCQHLDGHKCSRYDERPEVCQKFECLWRSGYLIGDERRRPDKLGLMLTFDVVPQRSGFEVMVVEVWELWEGAAANYPGRGVLDAVRDFTSNVTVRYYGVPCSRQYDGIADLAEGAEMSRMAREEPQKLAAWLRRLVDEHFLANAPDAQAVIDVAALERGEPVKAHFNH